MAVETEILVLKKGAHFARWQLGAGTYLLGRDPACALKLDDKGISREHARLTIAEDGVFIEDVGSKYGTLFEDKPIQGKLRLGAGRSVRIGKLDIEARALDTAMLSLPVATLPAKNQIGVPSAKAAPRSKDKPAVPQLKKPSPRWIVPAIINVAAFGLFAAFVMHLKQERQAAAQDRAIAEAERARAESVTAAASRAKSAPPAAAPLPAPVVQPSAIPNYYEHLRAFTSQPAWSSDRIRRLDDGTLRVNLSSLQIADLSALRALPVTELDLSNCLLRKIPDISSLTLRKLSLRDTTITDLSPLASQPLKELHLEGTPASDLTPLSALPLESLTLDDRLADLTALRGLPLRELDLRNHTRIRDFSPLLECRRLDILYVPENAEIECLRAHPSLKFIAIRDPQSPKPNAVDGPTPVFYFWKKYGALMGQRASRHATPSPPR